MTAYLLEELDRAGRLVAHVGIVGGRRDALRRAAAEADVRGVPQDLIAVIPVGAPAGPYSCSPTALEG